MKKLFNVLMLLVATSVVFISCDENKKALKEQVEIFNNTCPISFGGIMTINSVVLLDNTVEMKLSINESITPVSLINSHKEDFKDNLSMILTKESSSNLVENIVNAQVSLRAIFIGDQSGGRAEFEFTAHELKTAKEKFSNMTEAQKLITSNVIGMKIRLPQRVDQMTIMTGISITASDIVYKYEVDDRETGESLNQFTGFMKNITMSQMAAQIAQDGILGERNRKFFEALVECGQGVKVEYFEKNTGNRTSFSVTIAEIKSILNGEFQKNAPSMEDWENFGRAVDQLESMYADSVGVVDSVAEDYVW